MLKVIVDNLVTFDIPEVDYRTARLKPGEIIAVYVTLIWIASSSTESECFIENRSARIVLPDWPHRYLRGIEHGYLRCTAVRRQEKLCLLQHYFVEHFANGIFVNCSSDFTVQIAALTRFKH